ncbi:hypothetical protein MLD38_018818 [Melastoma candidum]|uniref:Uncharacterized protein n=1 Tax=Melastoma candidum TaxID=119954 RepID=A0ACB9QV31_9MYRT|nr:hypothetical protein MLD38_018818 [Melastoma candidum]
METEEGEEEKPFPTHKLCGFLFIALRSPSSQSPPRFSSPCSLSHSGFTTDDGLHLTPLGPPLDASPDNARSRCKASRFGMVKGSVSIVRQLHALVSNKCLQIDPRVIGTEVSEGEARVVVLVDVYLPMDVLTRRQFPRFRSVAAAVLQHLRCDWEERRAVLASREYYKVACVHGQVKGTWIIPDCHVLGCKLHSALPNASKKKLFDLHEIFNTLPGVGRTEIVDSSRLQPADGSRSSPFCDMSDDILTSILSYLGPSDLSSVAATCRHFRFLAAMIMPCMNLKLFPHQQTAVEWMLQRERKVRVLPHPLYRALSTEDGFALYVHVISGEVRAGTCPTVNDFSGGMFCDEPGLGKTVTALSLILKTQGTLPNPPDGHRVIWCAHNGDKRCGYYKLYGNCVGVGSMVPRQKVCSQNPRMRLLSISKRHLSGGSACPLPKKARMMACSDVKGETTDPYPGSEFESPSIFKESGKSVMRCSRSLRRVRKNILPLFDEAAGPFGKNSGGCDSSSEEYSAMDRAQNLNDNGCKTLDVIRDGHQRLVVDTDSDLNNDTWIQCDACHKWRKVEEISEANVSPAWFCSMNRNPLYQSCDLPQEPSDEHERITHLPGFCTKGTSGGEEQNVEFFVSVLKDNLALINSHTNKALNWLAALSAEKLSEMESIGLKGPCIISAEDADGFGKVFQSFGLLRTSEKGVGRWNYPKKLEGLAFDVVALRIALCEPLDSVRLYLSRATLIVVPANLVNHWKTQIHRHVRHGQLRVHVLADGRKISPHTLAWDYDVVITTFSRLSAEWALRRRKSVLLQVHWLRILLDEGHTLGSSVSLTNKLQMAISIPASHRWILTGTPTPNTPNSQLSHLQIMLKFLHDEAFGQGQKSWESGILWPFQAEMEDGRLRLLDLLHRCMISARKKDLTAIPPCIKKVKFLNFNEQHAKSYNELVVTVRRNVLMADWNDPSHVESLLNPKQWKLCSTTIRNIRLSCCVAGHINVKDAGEDIQETMDLLLEYGLDPQSEEYALTKYALLNGGNCILCREWCRLPIITPCRHLLCLDCVAMDSERCPLPSCSYSYEMQTPESRPENPNPKWAVPKDLIELQPSYKQDDWDPDWQSTSSSKVSYLIERMKELLDANELLSSSNNVDRDVVDSQNHMMVASRDQPGFITNSKKSTLEKVIVFSQFLEHIHVIEQQLMLAGIKFSGMYSPMQSSSKVKSLATFQNDSDCLVLLMDGSAALGLDLSFVTCVFLMEPIWDKSMEEQVVSRAHRMGATRPVYVETLAMCGTIEQQMVEFLQDNDSCRRFLAEESEGHDNEGRRSHRSLHDFAGNNYLSRLKCVRSNSNVGFQT